MLSVRKGSDIKSEEKRRVDSELFRTRTGSLESESIDYEPSKNSNPFWLVPNNDILSVGILARVPVDRVWCRTSG